MDVLESFLQDSGQLSHPTSTDDIAKERVTNDNMENLINNWKRNMELQV